jgi:hypothetical protein
VTVAAGSDLGRTRSSIATDKTMRLNAQTAIIDTQPIQELIADGCHRVTRPEALSSISTSAALNRFCCSRTARLSAGYSSRWRSRPSR